MSDPAQVPLPGELAPRFITATDQNPRFHFDSLGGVWSLLLFHGSLEAPASRAALEAVLSARDVFDDVDAYFFGVSVDPRDRTEKGLKPTLPGIRYFWDFDASASRLYGVAQDGVYRATAFLLDRQKRVVAVAPASGVAGLIERLKRELLAEAEAREGLFAPVLTLPRIFEPELCRALINYYESVGGEPSGFMREVGGRTVRVSDTSFKRRRDATITDEGLVEATRVRITRRLIPAVEKFLGWRATRIERYIVACYSAEERDFFNAHRDNTTPGTAHRKFAVTINLNAEDYEGGELRFPEFGTRGYKPPTGGATVFCCSLLHQATPVTRGVRYAFVPFLYDEQGRAIREANLHTFSPALSAQPT